MNLVIALFTQDAAANLILYFSSQGNESHNFCVLKIRIFFPSIADLKCDYQETVVVVVVVDDVVAVV